MDPKQLCAEGDCIIAIRAASRVDGYCKELEPVIFDIRYLLRCHPTWSVVHVYRDCNQLAHTLEKLALTLSHEKIWVQSYLDQIASIVNNDVLISVY